MGLFLIVAALLFLIFGALLLLSPQALVKISNLTNRFVFAVDDYIHAWRRPAGIIFLALSIYCWYLGWSQ